MVIIALLLLLAVLAVTLAALLRGGDSARVDLDVFTVNTNVTGVFVGGAVTLLVAVLGLWLLAKGLKRNRRKRAEMHELRHRARQADDAAARRQSRPANGAETSRPDADGHSDSTPRDS